MSFLGKLHVVDLEGTPRARGQQHGEALRDVIEEHHRRWYAALGEALDADPLPYLDTLLAETRLLNVAEAETPELVDELHGIAEGSGVPFARVFARALSDEEPWFRIEHLAARDAVGKGCSSLGANADAAGRVLIAQTMDVPTWWDGGQTLLRIALPNGDRALVFTVAGKISLCGMTRRGLAITCNSLLQLDHSSDALAEDFVVRRYLASGDAAAGYRFLHEVHHASGQNYIVPDGAGRAVSLECSTRSVDEWRRDAEDPCVAHSNHPLVNPHRVWFNSVIAPMDHAAQQALFGFTSEARLETLYNRLPQGRGFDVEEAKAMLACREGPICRVGEVEGKRDGFSFGSLVMELGEAPRLHVAPGPADRTAWQEFEA